MPTKCVQLLLDLNPETLAILSPTHWVAVLIPPLVEAGQGDLQPLALPDLAPGLRILYICRGSSLKHHTLIVNCFQS